MPPKKKGGKKGKSGGKEGKTPVVIDNVAAEEMTKEQLEDHVLRLREQLDRERKERNFHQLERDRVHSFWDITQQKLVDLQAQLRNKDREMEEAEERHQIEIKVYKQKVKHLMYEHQNNIAQLKAEGIVALKLAEDGNRMNEMDLRKDKRNLKIELKEKELSHEDTIKTLKLKNDEDMTNLQNAFECKAKEIESKYEKKMKALRDELELKRKFEIHEIEERKNSQINTLMKNHEKAFSDIKNYYNDITLINFGLINVLKEQVDDMKKKEERLEKEMANLTTENKRLVEPLQHAREEVDELRKSLANYEKDKQSLKMTKARLKVTLEELKALKWEHEVLEQRFEKEEKNSSNPTPTPSHTPTHTPVEVQSIAAKSSNEIDDINLNDPELAAAAVKIQTSFRGHITRKDQKKTEDVIQAERDELYSRFVKSIHEVQQKSSFKNILLEKKLSALGELLEQKECQLNEILSCSNLDPSTLNMITRKLEEVLLSKNTAIKDLQFELARVCKAHNDMLRTYEAKLKTFGIPVEELGFKPLESSVSEHILGKGPAGLVSAQV